MLAACQYILIRLGWIQGYTQKYTRLKNQFSTVLKLDGSADYAGLMLILGNYQDFSRISKIFKVLSGFRVKIY